MNGFIEAARIQRRVVWALMLRETKTLFGRHKLGYLWALINTSFSIGVFWALREVGGFTTPQGISLPVFLVGGFIPWFTFSNTVSGAMNGVSGNRALLAYPQVFPLDIFLARALLQGAMNLCVLVILLIAAYYSGYLVFISDPMAMLFSLALALILGLGVGAIASAFTLMWPTTQLIMPMILRVLFFTSGLFFSVEYAPIYVQEILFYNPISHLVETLRYGMSNGYGRDFASIPYALWFALSSVFIGLLLEKYSRKYLDQSS
jgi:capsular polysaccharide transport system permease protein